jgi:hypothetical protein
MILSTNSFYQMGCHRGRGKDDDGGGGQHVRGDCWVGSWGGDKSDDGDERRQ